MKCTFLLLGLLALSLSALSLGIPADAASPVLEFSPGFAPSSAPSVPQSATAPDAPPPSNAAESTALSFALPQGTAIAPPPAKPAVSPRSLTQPVTLPDRANLFQGGSDSLVARTVGHAEGTRTADGGKTRAYYGHTDPGNGVWNRGTFSYQFGNLENLSPEKADQRQLAKLQGQYQTLLQRALAQQVDLTLEEELNGIDLANQAPLAAIGLPGYIEWLRKARDQGLRGSEAVLWARVQSFWNPVRNRWDAPGLGNTEERIINDQERRRSAIARALSVYQQQWVAQKQTVQSKLAKKPAQKEQSTDSVTF